MKTKIILHGKIAKIYGKEFEFHNINKPTDVIYAMDTMFPGFRKYIVNKAREGLSYEIIVNGETETAFSMNNTKNIKAKAPIKNIHFIDELYKFCSKLEVMISKL